MKKRTLVQKFQPNSKGKDYITGDIHGMYDLLMYHLKNSLNFNFKKDRLFIVGDLIDRGQQSVECLKLLNNDWCFSILGNHESMMLSSYYHEHIKHDLIFKVWLKDAVQKWLNGHGKWFNSLLEETQEELVDIALGLPLFIELETKQGKKIGISHGDFYLEDWNDIYPLITEYDNKINYLTNQLETTNDKNTIQQILDSNVYFLPRELELFLWERSKYNDMHAFDNDNYHVKNIDLITVGHSVIQYKPNEFNQVYKEPFLIGNTLYLDSGTCMPYYQKEMIKILDRSVNKIKNNINTYNQDEYVKNINKMETMQSKIFQMEHFLEDKPFSISFYDVDKQKVIQFPV